MHKKAILFTSLILLTVTLVFSQEWKSLHAYKKESGNTVLQDACWLKKDRKREIEV